MCISNGKVPHEKGAAPTMTDVRKQVELFPDWGGCEGGGMDNTTTKGDKDGVAKEQQQQPMTPNDIYSFWFHQNSMKNTKDTNDDSQQQQTQQQQQQKQQNSTKFHYLSDPFYIDRMLLCWMQGGEAMDNKCKPFSNLVRVVGHYVYGVKMSSSLCASTVAEVEELYRTMESKDLLKDWKNTQRKETLVATVILLDQMARNCFRYTSEAFAYEKAIGTVIDNIAKLANKTKKNNNDDNNNNDDAESNLNIGNLLNNNDDDNSDKNANFHFAECFFIIITLQHTEKLECHYMEAQIAKAMNQKFPQMKKTLKVIKYHSDNHNDVIKMFGRYPHRNNQYNRTTTKEEQEWLNNYEQLPQWVKSQMMNSMPQSKKNTRKK